MKDSTSTSGDTYGRSGSGKSVLLKHLVGLSKPDSGRVIVDGAPVHSCIVPAQRVDGAVVTTAGGLAPGDDLHPVQEQLVEHFGFQCGFCTPGMAVTASTLTEADLPELDRRIRAALVDKDRSPQWKPATLAEVTSSYIDEHFESLGDQELVLN